MRQDVSKGTQSNVKKRYQISFRRWIKGQGGGGTIERFVGADNFTVRNHISSLFIDGMNWNNYGELWVIDHIVPLRLFDMTSNEDCKIGFHYKNTFPLLTEDNLYKEGNLGFSKLLLNQMAPCPITEKLHAIIDREIISLHKYLKHPSSREAKALNQNT